MGQALDKLNNIKLPPKVLRELGLDKNWQRNVSPEFLEKVVNTAERYRNTLRRLSKH